jgi:hypothetical protein
MVRPWHASMPATDLSVPIDETDLNGRAVSASLLRDGLAELRLPQRGPFLRCRMRTSPPED